MHEDCYKIFKNSEEIGNKKILNSGDMIIYNQSSEQPFPQRLPEFSNHKNLWSSIIQSLEIIVKTRHQPGIIFNI